MNEDYADSIAMAAQLGRLDFASALLAVGGLALGVVAVALLLGGIFAWNYFHEVAKSQATIEATRIAEELAERKANEYLQDNLHVIVDAYMSMFERMVNDRADDIAGSQEDQTEDNT